MTKRSVGGIGQRARAWSRLGCIAAWLLPSAGPLPARAETAPAGPGPVSLDLVSNWLRDLLPTAFFDYNLFGLALWQWLCLLALALATAVLSWLAAVAILRALRPLAARTDSAIDDRVLDNAGAPLRLVIAVAIFRIGVEPLALAPEVRHFISDLASALAIVAVSWGLLRATDGFAAQVEERLKTRGQHDALTLVPPGRKAVKAAITAMAAVAVLDSFGFSVTALLAGLGVGGIAVALAAQKTVENLFGGLSLYLDRPVRVGDFCKFGDQVGTIEEIGMRSTRIRTLDRTIVSVPNGQFASLQLENFAVRDRIRFYTVIGLRYETTPDQLRHVLIEIRNLLYAHERVTPDPARIRFIGFGAYSLDLEIFSYVNTSDWNEFLGIREDLLLRIMDAVEATGTGFAFPSQTLYLGRDDGLPEEQMRHAAEQVRAWRSRGELYLPDFTPERIAELQNTVHFPPEGAPGR